MTSIRHGWAGVVTLLLRTGTSAPALSRSLRPLPTVGEVDTSNTPSPRGHLYLLITETNLANPATPAACAPEPFSCNDEPITINSQDDATALSKCPVDKWSPLRNRQVVIGQSATGVLDFGDFRLNGSIRAEDNPSLTGLAFKSDDWSDTGYSVTLRNMSKLKSFSFTGLEQAGSIIFQDLAALETVEMPSLHQIWDTLRLQGLPRLQSFHHDRSSPLSVWRITEIKDVGLSSLDDIFTTLQPDSSVAVEELSNVKTINLLNTEVGSLLIRGKGDLDLHFGCPNCKLEVPRSTSVSVRVRSLTVSGLGTMHRNHTRDGSTGVLLGNFTARQNSFRYLPLDFHNLTNLHILDNPDLETVSFDGASWAWPWKDIVIKGNPKLHMTALGFGPAKPNYTADNLTTTFQWPHGGGFSTAVFDGAFDNVFL